MINEKIIDANFLKLVSSKLKLVLNPTQWSVDDEENRLYFSLSTDLEAIDDLTVLVNGVTEDESVLIFCGYISSNSITGINQGSQRIKCLGYYFEDLLLKIVVGVDNPDDSEDPSPIRRLLSEVFIPGDTKNHCTEISALEEFPTVTAYETSFAGESSDNWEFTIVGNLDTDGPSINPRSLTISPEFTYTIDKISKSQTADKLANNITFNVSGEGIESTSTTLDFDDDPTSVDLEVNVDTTDIENYIDLAVASKPISPASTTVLGGFREYGGTGSPQKSTNLCVVKMDHTNDYHYAYVDLNDIGADVHRYTDMSRATAEHEIGDIVQFIGTTDSNYTKGYFYIRTRRNISGTLASTSNWITDSSINLDEKLSTYNQSNDYLLPVPGTIIIIPNIPNTSGVISESGTIVNSTLCYLTCNTFSDTLTYEEVKALGIKLSQEAYTAGLNLSVYTASIAIVYSLTDNPPVWVQKNVLPVVRVGAPLVYRGTVTALQGETDIEALTRVVVNPEDGDFYTVLPSQLEYFWYNGEWQDGGNLFDVDIKDLRDSTGLRTTWSNKQDVITAGTGLLLASDGVTINHSNAVTAGTAEGSATKTLTFGDTFDIPTVTYDAQGHVTAKGTTTMTMPANPNTDTQADWNESNTSSAAYINNKPTIPAAQVNADWNSTSGVSEILNKPSLAAVATSGAYSDLTGTPTIPAAQVQTDWNATTGIGVLLNKPTIPIVNNGTYSIKTNVSATETTVSYFTANQSGNEDVTFVLGSNIILTPDTTNRTITIAASYGTATGSDAGLVKSTTTGTTAGRDYYVEVNSDGSMKVNVPWTDSWYGDTLTIVKTDDIYESNANWTYFPVSEIGLPTFVIKRYYRYIKILSTLSWLGSKNLLFIEGTIDQLKPCTIINSFSSPGITALPIDIHYLGDTTHHYYIADGRCITIYGGINEPSSTLWFAESSSTPVEDRLSFGVQTCYICQVGQ